MSSERRSYSGILHRKAKGSLELSESGFNFRPDSGGENGTIEIIPWNRTIKHQVSPASHSKSLLKILVAAAAASANSGGNNASNSSFTFVFPSRSDLESARKEITCRLNNNNNHSVNKEVNTTSSSSNKKKKRPRSEQYGKSTPPASSYITHDPMALIATRSSLLASDPALRAQHRLLVIDNYDGTLKAIDCHINSVRYDMVLESTAGGRLRCLIRSPTTL
eukprot:scaffold10554_cov76-Skeletonema_dohrnii-CCMP3373.AAC.1